MASRSKIAVSLSREVLDLVDLHARGRSRSQCIEQELLRALRAREWERLSVQLEPAELDEQVEWAEAAFAAADTALARDERPRHPPRRKRVRAR